MPHRSLPLTVFCLELPHPSRSTKFLFFPPSLPAGVELSFLQQQELEEKNLLYHVVEYEHSLRSIFLIFEIDPTLPASQAGWLITKTRAFLRWNNHLQVQVNAKIVQSHVNKLATIKKQANEKYNAAMGI